MKVSTEPIHQCLNCGTEILGTFCHNCGQKAQATKLSVKQYADEVLINHFSFDNRLIRTIRSLFLRPGRLTNEYLSGKRADYLPAFKLYFSASIIYFLLVTVFKTDEIFFINNLDLDGHETAFISFLRYFMIVLLPVLAALIQLIYINQKRLYVEFLIYTIHLMVIWFFLFGLTAVFGFVLENYAESGFLFYLMSALKTLSYFGIFVYLILSLKTVFGKSWTKTVFSSLLVIAGYLFLLVLVLLLFIFIWM